MAKYSFSSSGSALLIVVLFLSLIGLICIRVWNSSALLIDIHGHRYHYLQNYYAAQAAIQWALALYKDHTDQVEEHLNKKGSFICTLTQWPPPAGTCDVVLHFEKTADDKVACSCRLSEDNHAYLLVSCLLRKIVLPDQTRRIYLSHWYDKPSASKQ